MPQASPHGCGKPSGLSQGQRQTHDGDLKNGDGLFGRCPTKLVLDSAGQLGTNQPVRILCGEPLARAEPDPFFASEENSWFQINK